MAARKPAIQSRQGHPEGITDDILIPIAKKLIRMSQKGRATAKGLAKETKIINKRHVKLMNARREADFLGKAKKFTRVDKKVTKNLRAGKETAAAYNTTRTNAGLPRYAMLSSSEKAKIRAAAARRAKSKPRIK